MSATAQQMLAGLAAGRVSAVLVAAPAGAARCRDVALQSGAADEGWGTEDVWRDDHRDGHPGLFLANEVPWTPDTEVACSLEGPTRSGFVTPGASPVRFLEEDVSADIGLDEKNIARAGIGIVAAVYGRSGRASLVVPNFSSEMVPPFRAEGSGRFIDRAPAAGLAAGRVSVPPVERGVPRRR